MADTIVTHPVLERLGIEPVNSGACGREWIASPGGPTIASLNPADGQELASVRMASEQDYEAIVAQSVEVFERGRMLPAPQRGQIVREIGDELRRFKDDLGTLVTLEMGKILAEGKGEVQEMIDVADFAVGLSRQLYGLTMHSERPGHRMYEQWHPLGIVGIVSAFNFPVAVWAWNAMIAAVCGDCVVWRPSSETPLTAIAVQKICNRVLDRHGSGFFARHDLHDQQPRRGRNEFDHASQFGIRGFRNGTQVFRGSGGRKPYGEDLARGRGSRAAEVLPGVHESHRQGGGVPPAGRTGVAQNPGTGVEHRAASHLQFGERRAVPVLADRHGQGLSAARGHGHEVWSAASEAGHRSQPGASVVQPDRYRAGARWRSRQGGLRRRTGAHDVFQGSGRHAAVRHDADNGRARDERSRDICYRRGSRGAPECERQVVAPLNCGAGLQSCGRRPRRPVAGPGGPAQTWRSAPHHLPRATIWLRMSIPAEKRDLRLMRAMFSTIAPRYDFFTRIFSYGMDRRWKRRGVEMAGLPERAMVLDLASGTGDFSQLVVERCPQARSIAVDLTERMLRLARERGIRDAVCADATILPFPEHT